MRSGKTRHRSNYRPGSQWACPNWMGVAECICVKKWLHTPFLPGLLEIECNGDLWPVSHTLYGGVYQVVLQRNDFLDARRQIQRMESGCCRKKSGIRPPSHPIIDFSGSVECRLVEKGLRKFQGAMDVQHTDVKWQFALVYLDHTVLFWETADEQADHVPHILTLLYEDGKNLNLKRLALLTNGIILLGQVTCPGCLISIIKQDWLHTHTSMSSNQEQPSVITSILGCTLSNRAELCSNRWFLDQQSAERSIPDLPLINLWQNYRLRDA